MRKLNNLTTISYSHGSWAPHQAGGRKTRTCHCESRMLLRLEAIPCQARRLLRTRNGVSQPLAMTIHQKRRSHDKFSTSRLPRRPAHWQGTRCIGPACLVGAERHHKGFLHATGRIRFRGLRPRPLSWQGRRQHCRAETLGNALDANHLQAKAEIAEAACFSTNVLEADRGLAVIGFSLGALACHHRSRTHPFRRHLLWHRGR